jgi:myo-inositol 2-dehydrogenase / D-chiro-inositol 1-dehydrogenase
VALIVAGGWGKQHARVFAGRRDFDFCAVAGRSRERTKARAEEFGAGYYLDIQEMLDRERPDLVSVCLPNLGQFGPTLQVIEAGFPLLVEKPLSSYPPLRNRSARSPRATLSTFMPRRASSVHG